MKIFPVDLRAGEELRIDYAGKFVRCLSAEARFKLKVPEVGINSDFYAMLSTEFPRFSHVVLLSAVDQSVEIVISDYPIDDDRLAGEVDLSGALEMMSTAADVVNMGVVAVTDTATEIIGTNTDRRSAVVQVDETGGAVYYGIDNTVTDVTGMLVRPGGVLQVENSQPVFLICSAGESASVRYLEEVN